MNGCRYDCIPTDLIIKGESHSEQETGGGGGRGGVVAGRDAGSPSARHKSSDVTNAVNVLACLQYGPPERAKPMGSLLSVDSYTSQKFIEQSNSNFCLTGFSIFAYVL